MAAVAQTGSNLYHSTGNLTTVTAIFTAPADTNTWDTGLSQVDFFSFQITGEAGVDAADAIVGTASNGTITLDIASGALAATVAMAMGV